MKCKIKLSITDEKKKIKIEQLCFINRVWEHFLEDMSLNTLQTTSEMIQPSKVYHKFKKKIETNTVNLWQREQKPTKWHQIWLMPPHLPPFFYVDDKS
jgi:hypothetical protein